MAHRGGGSNLQEMLAGVHSANNCTRLCEAAMQESGLHAPAYPGYDPHYVKCYDGLSSVIQNNIRFAFPSQQASNNIDSALPLMAIGNVSACLRVAF